MRDTSCLRTRIALLACLPGLATALPGCSPPTKPQPVREEDEATREALEAREKAMELPRSTQLVPPGKQDEILIDPKQREHYERLAKEQGKTLEEVAPEKVVEAIRQQELRDKRLAIAKRKAAKARGELPKKPKEPEVPEVPEAPAPSENPFGLFPGDPPYIDGYNPEEETCVSGNWCGAAEAAEAVSVPSIPMVDECPSKITGGKSSDLIKADPKTYEGLSSAPNMQGSFNEHGTELSRERTGNASMCCYHWFEYCSGRPHLGQDGPVLAPVGEGAAWLHEATASPRPELSSALRERIAEQWREDGRAEHASVAAFARATLELMAAGAPPELLAQAQQAGLDEIEHARRCLSLAARYGATAVQPGPLPALAPRPADLGRLAADTFAEGCVGETIAALSAQRAARGCTDPRIREILETIADDEARHAALAWSTIAWALREGGAPVAEALREAATVLRRPDASLPAGDPEASVLAAHGRLDARAQAQAASDAWEELIDPMLQSLLADPRQPRADASA